jgi:hypothetical protein
MGKNDTPSLSFAETRKQTEHSKPETIQSALSQSATGVSRITAWPGETQNVATFPKRDPVIN